MPVDVPSRLRGRDGARPLTFLTRPATPACARWRGSLRAGPPAARPRGPLRRRGIALLLPNTDAEGCELVGENVRRALRELGMLHALNSSSKIVTVAWGGVNHLPARGAPDCGSLWRPPSANSMRPRDRGRNRLVMSGQVVAWPGAKSSHPVDPSTLGRAMRRAWRSALAAAASLAAGPRTSSWMRKTTAASTRRATSCTPAADAAALTDASRTLQEHAGARSVSGDRRGAFWIPQPNQNSPLDGVSQTGQRAANVATS